MLQVSNKNKRVLLRALFCLISVGLCSPSHAQDSSAYRGVVGSFTNDYFGDGHDRWNSGSYQRSYYSEGFRNSFFQGIELRARAEIVSPWTPAHQSDADRPYSTLLGFGAFGHSTVAGFETRLGAELLLLGDVSGMETLQQAFHKAFQMEESFDSSDADVAHTEDGVTARIDFEIARTFRLGDNAMVRPYVELAGGADQVGSAGLDVVLGPVASADIWTRDVVTGRLLTPEVDQIGGWSLVAGGDIREVATSVHLPEDSAVELEPTQHRLRLGVQSNSDLGNFFIGQAWLSPNFVGQAETQRVGMLSISFLF